MRKHVFKHAAKATWNVLFYMTIIMLLIFSAANIKVKKENDIAHVFGTGFLSVQSNSMMGNHDDSFQKGDLIFVRMINEQQKSNLQIGEVVTYFDYSIKAFNTHRIVDRFELDGEVYYITQGDYATEPDALPLNHTLVLATYKNHVTGVGSILDYLKTGAGYALFIILPVIFILVIEGMIMIKNIMNSSKLKFEKQFKMIEAQAMSELEIEKEKIRKQILSELKIGQEPKTS